MIVSVFLLWEGPGLRRETDCPTRRLPRACLRWNEIHSTFHAHCHGRQEPLPWYCLRRGWRHLHCSRSTLYSNTLDQTQVSRNSHVATKSRSSKPQRRILFADQWQNNDRKLGDHSYLSWNSDQPSSATTTGRAGRHGEGA